MNTFIEILKTLGESIGSTFMAILKLAYEISGIRDLIQNNMIGAVLGISAGAAGLLTTIIGIIVFFVKRAKRR